MYGKREGVSESGGGKIQPGVHEVCIKSVDLVTGINTQHYQGNAAQVVYESKDGSTLECRIFPFKVNPNFKDRNGNMEPEETQLKGYLSKRLHQFKYAMGDTKTTDDNYFKNVPESLDTFEGWVQAVQPAVKANGGQDFKILVVAKQGKYPSYPEWKNGCSGTLTDTLNFDPVKHGYAEKKESEMESISSEEDGENEMPF